MHALPVEFISLFDSWPVTQTMKDLPQGVKPRFINEMVQTILKHLPPRPQRNIVRRVIRQTVSTYINGHPEYNFPKNPEVYIPFVLRGIKTRIHGRGGWQPIGYRRVTEIVEEMHIPEPRGDIPAGVEPFEFQRIVAEIKRILRTQQTKNQRDVRRVIVAVVQSHIGNNPNYKPNDYLPYIVKHLLGHTKPQQFPQSTRSPLSRDIIQIFRQWPFREPKEDFPQNVDPADFMKMVQQVLRDIPTMAERQAIQRIMRRTVTTYISRHPEDKSPKKPAEYIPYILKQLKKLTNIQDRRSTPQKSPLRSIVDILGSLRVRVPRDNAPRGIAPREFTEIVERIRNILDSVEQPTVGNVRIIIMNNVREWIPKHPEYTANDIIPYIVKYLLQQVSRPTEQTTTDFESIMRIIGKYPVTRPREEAPKGVEPTELLDLANRIRAIFQQQPRQPVNRIRVIILDIVSNVFSPNHPEFSVEELFPYVLKYLLGYKPEPKTTDFESIMKIIARFPERKPRSEAPRGVDPKELLDLANRIRAIFQQQPRQTVTSIRAVLITVTEEHSNRYPRYGPNDLLPYVIKYILGYKPKPKEPETSDFESILKIIQQYGVFEPKYDSPRGVSERELIEIAQQITNVFKRNPRQTATTIRVVIFKFVERLITKHPEYTPEDMIPYVVKYLIGRTQPREPTTTSYSSIIELIKQLGIMEPKSDSPKGLDPNEIIMITEMIRKRFQQQPRQTPRTTRIIMLDVVSEYARRHPAYTPETLIPFIVKHLLGHAGKGFYVSASRVPEWLLTIFYTFDQAQTVPRNLIPRKLLTDVVQQAISALLPLEKTELKRRPQSLIRVVESVLSNFHHNHPRTQMKSLVAYLIEVLKRSQEKHVLFKFPGSSGAIEYTVTDIYTIVTRYFSQMRGFQHPEQHRSILVRFLIELIMSKQPNKSFDKMFVQQYDILFTYIRHVINQQRVYRGQSPTILSEHLYIPLTRDLVDGAVSGVMESIFKTTRLPRSEAMKVSAAVRQNLFHYFIKVRQVTLRKYMPKIMTQPDFRHYDINLYSQKWNEFPFVEGIREFGGKFNLNAEFFKTLLSRHVAPQRIVRNDLFSNHTYKNKFSRETMRGRRAYRERTVTYQDNSLVNKQSV